MGVYLSNHLEETFYDVIESGDYYIAAGYSSSNLESFTGGSDTMGGGDFVIAKFNKSDLSLVSINNLGGTEDDKFNSIIVSGDYCIAAGFSESDLSGQTGGSNTEGNNDFVIAKFSIADLSLVNINYCGGTQQDYYYSMINSGDYFITAGYSYSNLSGITGGSDTTGNSDFVIARYYEDINLD